MAQDALDGTSLPFGETVQSVAGSKRKIRRPNGARVKCVGLNKVAGCTQDAVG
jgi:hypothetical protein